MLSPLRECVRLAQLRNPSRIRVPKDQRTEVLERDGLTPLQLLSDEALLRHL
jgi:hypothetical protein